VRLRVFDQLQRWRPRPVPADSPVTIVDIDDDSLAEIGQWPWPRTVFADLVETLGRHGPRAIVFDVLFAEADRLSPPSYARLLEPVDARAAAVLRTLPSSEETMAAALRRFPVVLGEAGAAGTAERRFARGLDPPARIAWLGGDARRALPTFAHGITALPTLAAAARGLGLVTVPAEVDGVVRRAPTVAVVGERLLPSLSLEAVRVASGEGTLIVRGDERGAVRSVAVDGHSLPTDVDGRVGLRFTPRRGDLYVPAVRALAGEMPPERIAGKIVVVGSSAVSLGDVKVTPVAGNTPGVEIQAQLIESILMGDLLRRPPALVGVELALVLGLGLLLAWFGVRLPAGSFPPLLAGVLAVAGATTWFAYAGAGYLVDATYPAFAFALLLFWLAMAKYIREETGRRSLRHAFAHYLSPVMVDRLIRNPVALALEGDRRPLTVLFSDIRDFTALTEGYADDPEGLTRLLNRYFTAMTEEVLAQEGTIDKYIGDSIMAFWNAPLDDPRHARHACLAALRMVGRLERLNEELAAEASASGQPFAPLRAGIGVETGSCFVGNLGSAQRFNYSVIGDAVNVASRLEASSKLHGLPIIVGEKVRAACPELAFLPIGVVQLRGKRGTSLVYALVGDEALARAPLWPELTANQDALLRALRDRAAAEVDAALGRGEALARELGLGETYAGFARALEEHARGPG
jgi:adenylate cyclase